ncbi:MAG: OmpA family protein, partial [Ilumatobacter sp.]
TADVTDDTSAASTDSLGSATEPTIAEPTAASTTSTPDDSPTSDAGDVVRPVIPRIPTVRPPNVSSLTQGGERVAASLGELASPAGGIEVVGARCAEGGGELQYDGSTGADVFDIEADGSGIFYEESPDGLTTLEVREDGTGRFYDESGTGLVTIAVEPDQSGEYYQKQGDDLVTVRVGADGSGEYYDATLDRLLTITLEPDGSGRLYDKGETSLVTVDARADGSGEYYREIPGEVTTIVADADGSWKYTYTAAARIVTLEVAADGTGVYDEAGRDSIEIEFDEQGRSADGRTIVLPPTPEFSVTSGFPPLGTLGSLAPPCATVIRLDSSVLFDFGLAVLRPEADPVLDEVVTVLSDSGKPIDIVGHTDSIGTDEANLELSLERARAVEAALRARGLSVDIAVDGRGESEPVAPNETPTGEDDPAGRAQNRRVDITIRE